MIRSKNPKTENLGSILSQSSKSKVSLEKRLEIYRHAYCERIKESLAEDFPKLRTLLGEEEFKRLIRDYLEEYPSQYPNLAQVGKNLPKFLAESSQFSSSSEQKEHSELAQTEWAHCLCKWSELTQPEDFSKLLELPEEEQLKQTLVLAPSAQFLKNQVIFKAARKVPTKTSANSGFEIKTLELTPSMEKLLDEIQKGRSLGELIQLLQNDEPAPTAANPDAQSGAVLDAATTMTWISNWVATGLITSYQPKKSN
jgi:hypothetical protein